MGFLGPEKYVAGELEAKLDGRGNYETPGGKYSTSIPGVFAAGGLSFSLLPEALVATYKSILNNFAN